MDKETKNKWIKALRSGKYKQAKERLYKREEDAYCCLGVLLACTGHRNFKTDAAHENEEGYGTLERKWGDTLYAQHEESSTGLVYRLMRMNDRGDNFSKIASFLERLL